MKIPLRGETWPWDQLQIILKEFYEFIKLNFKCAMMVTIINSIGRVMEMTIMKWMPVVNQSFNNIN